MEDIAEEAKEEGKSEPEKYPSQVIEPLAGELHFFLDKAAAARL